MILIEFQQSNKILSIKEIIKEVKKNKILRQP